MTGVLFCGLLVSLGTITTLFVEFLKSVFNGYKKTYNAQTISLISGVVTGIVGTTMVYIVMGIPFTPVNIVFIVFETIWDGSKDYTNAPVGTPVADENQVWSLIQPHNAANYPGTRPSGLRALWGLLHTKTPKKPNLG